MKEFDDSRVQYFANLDTWALSRTVRYPYAQVKYRFMYNLRIASHADTDTAFLRTVRALPADIAYEYYNLLDREWFSLTDVNELFQRRGVTLENPTMQYQGLLNQITFNEYTGTSLAGGDTGYFLHEAEAVNPARLNRRLQTVSLGEILERAATVLTVPSLELLAKLSPDDIAALRSSGESYFTLLEKSRDEDYWRTSQAVFGRQFVRAASSYWQTVCDHVRSKYTDLAEYETRLAIMTGYDPGHSSLPRGIIPMTVEAGTDFAASTVPGASQAIDVARRLGPAKFRFLFLTPTQGFVNLTKVLLPALLNSSDVLLLTLEFGGELLRDVIAMVASASSQKPTVVVNPAPMDGISPARLEELRGADWIIPNLHEARKLLGDPEVLPGEAVVRLSDVTGGGVCVTVGDRGCYYSVEADGPVRVAHEPSFRVQVVDTTGASDAFCGLLAACLARDEPFSEAMAMASAGAALACTKFGSVSAMPQWAEVASLLGNADRGPAGRRPI